MRALLSHILLGAGLVCAGTAIFIVVGAQAYQSNMARHWAESELKPSNNRTVFPPGAIARLYFRRHKKQLFVWGDEHPDHLLKGPVWLRQTRSFATVGNTVVAGHRDTHFRFLKDVKVGDVFEVDQDDNTQLKFRISKMQIVYPTDRSLLQPTAEKTVTLVTCYPFYVVGKANRRMIIRAELVKLPTRPGGKKK